MVTVIALYAYAWIMVMTFGACKDQGKDKVGTVETNKGDVREELNAMFLMEDVNHQEAVADAREKLEYRTMTMDNDKEAKKMKTSKCRSDLFTVWILFVVYGLIFYLIYRAESKDSEPKNNQKYKVFVIEA